jgi:hypothetical protein
MKYSPENELTEEQVTALPEDEFFEYIDSKAAYLKQFTTPLSQYHTKKFATAALGGSIDTKNLRKAKKIGKEGDIIRAQNIKEAATKISAKIPDLYVKHHKTKRGQWFE